MNTAYQTELEEWRNQRMADLKSKDGFLNLAGLYWLEEGVNSFGTDSLNKLVFPSGKAASHMGSLVLTNGEVFLKVAEGVAISYEEKPVENMKIFGNDITKPVLLSHQSLTWFVIQRGEHIGVRLKDYEHPALTQPIDIEHFPTNESWKSTASFTPFDIPRTKANKNILDFDIEQTFTGRLHFQLNGNDYSLEPTVGGDMMYVLFADATSGKETYGGGRYIEITKPDREGKTIIDFNKAYNPPCAFTPFATCPLPIPENRLSIAVLAGEKAYNSENH